MSLKSFQSWLDWRFFFGIGLGLFIGSMVILSGPATVPQNPPLSGQEEIAAKARELGMVDQGVYNQSQERIKALEGEVQKLKALPAQMTEKTTFVVEIPSGVSSEGIMNRLINAGVQINAADFSKEVEKRGLGSRFHSGSFSFDKNESLDSILSKLTR